MLKPFGDALRVSEMQHGRLDEPHLDRGRLSSRSPMR
jgi:hypothetical protein